MTRHLPQPYEFGDFFSPAGRLERPLPMAPWFAPRLVELNDKKTRLFYDEYETKHVPLDGRLLERFLKLADGTPAEIRNFAQTYGVFGICNHGLPWTHSYSIAMLGSHRAIGHCRCLSTADGDTYDPVAVWHRLAREARALMNIAYKNDEGEAGNGNDWSILRNSPITCRVARVRTKGSAVENDRRIVSLVLNMWVDAAGMRPIAYMDADKLIRLQLSGGLMGALALNMMSAITKGSGFAICAGCARFFEVQTRVSPGRNRYCDRCGPRAARRAASRAYRQRQRGERSGTNK